MSWGCNMDFMSALRGITPAKKGLNLFGDTMLGSLMNTSSKYVAPLATTAGNMSNGGFLNSLWDGTKDFFSSHTDNKGNVLPSSAERFGKIGLDFWGGYNRQKMAQKNFDLQKQAMNYNIAQNEELKRRQDKQTKQLASIWGD